MFNPGNLENNGANQDDIQKRTSENFVGHNMSLTSNNANSPQSESASKTSTTAALRRWRRPEAQDNNTKNVSSTRGSSNDTENNIKIPSSTVNQSKEMNPLNNNNNNNNSNNNNYSANNNTHHIDNLNNGSASQNDYSMFVSPASLSPIVPQSTARPYDTNAYIPRVPPETGAYSRTSPIVTTPNKLTTPEVKSSDTTVRHPISGNIQSPYYPHDNTAQQHYRSTTTTGYPIQNTPPLTPTSTQSPIYGVPNQKRDFGYQNYTSKSPQEQRLTREHSVLTHSYSAGSGMNLDSARLQGLGGEDASKMNGYRQAYHLQNSAERRVTPPKPKSPTYRNFPNNSAIMDSRIAQNYVTTSGRVQSAEYMAQNYYLNKSSCIVQEARVQNQIHSTENPILDGRYQQSYNGYIMPKSAVINSQDPKLYRNIITSSKKHGGAPFPILEQRLNTAESYSPEYLAQNNSQAKYGQVIMPRSSPTSRITRDGTSIPMHSNYIPQASNQKCPPQDMMIPSNYALHNKYFQQNAIQPDWRLIKDYESNAHLNQINQMHSRLPHSSTNRTPEVPRDVPFMDQNQRIIQKHRMFYPEPGSVEYLQYAAGKTNIPVAQKSPKVISYNVSSSDQIQNDYLNLPRNASNAAVRAPNEYSRNPVIQTPNVQEGPYIVHQAYRSEVPNDQHNYQMVQNSRHPSYAINYSNRQVKEIPPRNISPRRTFQENMSYFVISPHAGVSNTSPPSLYNAEHSQHNYPGYYSRDPNYPGVGAKPNIPQYPLDPTKYQNVPFNRNISQQRLPYGYQEQYFQRNMDPNQFAGNMYRPHNPAISDQAAQARSYAEEYRNADSNYNEFERNRRKEEIGKSLKEFLESWEDDEDIVSNLPDLVLNIPTDRQKNNSVSSLESGENIEATGKTTIPTTNEIHKDNQGNPQAEPLYVLDARSISSDLLSQYLPYCKVYQSLPENIRGFYPNSVPTSEDASVQSQQVASETSETQADNEDLETNIIDSPSPHDLSVNRKKDKEDNVQAEVLNLSTNRNKENDEFMTEEYSNDASDDTSVPETASSPSINDTILSKEDTKEKCEVIKSLSGPETKVDVDKNDTSIKEDSASVINTKNIENEDKRESLETTIEKPVTASVIVQNTFVPNKLDNSSGKSKENQSEKPNLGESIEETSNNIFKDSSENIGSPKSKNVENKRPSVDSMESADSIRTSLIESEIKDIDFHKDNLDDQFDFDTALLSTETKDSNEDVLHDQKTDEDTNKNSLIRLRDNGIDLSLETMLLSPEPINTSFEDCIPEITSSPKTSISNNEDEKVIPTENEAEELNPPKSNQITTDSDSFEMPVDESKVLENVETELENPNKSENINETFLKENEEHSDNSEIEKDNELCLDATLNSTKLKSNQQIEENYNLFDSTDVDFNKESENEIKEQLTSKEDKIDDSKIEISEKEMDLSTMDDEDPICVPQFNNKSSFSMEQILKEVVIPRKYLQENTKIQTVNMGVSNISETKEQINETSPINEINETSPINEDNIETENCLENRENATEDIDDNLSEKSNTSSSDESSISEISHKSLTDVEFESETVPEQEENNQSFIIQTETSIETDTSDDLIKDKEINEEIILETDTLNNEHLISTNEVDKDEVIKDGQELPEVEKEHFENLIDTPSDDIANIEKLDTAETDITDDTNVETIKEVSVIYEENTSSEIDHLQKNTSDINLDVSNIISSPVSIQKEITLIEEIADNNITDETTKENQTNEIEVENENKSDIELISNKNKENENYNDEQMPIIKHELSLFDEDTMIGFEDLSNDIDKNMQPTDEINIEGKETTIEEFKTETILNSITNISDDKQNDYLEKDLNDTLQEITDHISSDSEEYQHLIKLEDEDTLENTDIEKNNTPINEDEDKTTINEEKDETPIHEEKDKTLINEEEDKTTINEEKDETPIHEEKDKTLIHEEKDKTLITEEEDKTTINEEKDETPIHEEKDETPTNEEQDKPPTYEEQNETPTNEEQDKTSINEEQDITSINATKIENELLTDSKETPNLVINNSSNILPCEEEEEEVEERSLEYFPETIEDILPIDCSEDKSSADDIISDRLLEDNKIETTDLLEDDVTTKVNVLFNEEILVEHLLTNENITFVENDSNEISEKVEENIIVPDDPNCVLLYSDDENIVILQSDPNELVNTEIEESTYITTEDTNVEEILTEEMVGEKDEFTPEEIIEEDIIGNEVIICENGIEDDWIQTEEIVETKMEDQDKKEDDRPKIEDIDKKRILMEKRREKKKRLEKLRKRKLISIIKATNKFLEEERKPYLISEILINENTNTISSFQEKTTDDKELFINPENPSSSSEDNSSMTHELLNLKPRIKRRFSFVDSISPKIDFVAPKRRYSNMEFVRNNFKRPIINLDEISNNITKVIENLNKQENIQYHHSLENLKPIYKFNRTIPDVSKTVIVNESKNNCPVLNNKNENRLGRFQISRVVNPEELFIKPAEIIVKPFVKPINHFNNVKEVTIQESNDEIMKPNNLEDGNKRDSTKLIESKNEDTNGKIEVKKHEDKFQSETNVLQSLKPLLNTNTNFDTITNTKCKNLPSFQNYTDDLRKKIKTDISIKHDTNNKMHLPTPTPTPTVVVKPLPVPKISPRLDSKPEIGITTSPFKNTLILPNKQRNDPRIDRPKEIPKPEVSPVLIKPKLPKTFGLTEYTKHYLKMKTGQTIDPQIHFGQNGIKRLDPRLTVKPVKTTKENVENVIVATKHKTDMNTKSKSNQEKKVKINLQDYRNRKLSLSESEKQSTSPKEQLDNSPVNSDPINGVSNTEPCRFYIRDKSEKSLDNKTVEKIVIKPKKILEKVSNDTFDVSKDHNLDCNNLSNDNINNTLKSKLDFKTQKPKKRKKRFRNLDASDEEDDVVVTKQQNVTQENGIVHDPQLKLLIEDSTTISKQHSSSASGDGICSCCVVDLNSNGGTTKNNCGLKCHIKLNSLDSKIRNYEINKNTSGISDLKLTLKPVQKKPKPAFAEVLTSIDTVVETDVVKAPKPRPRKPGLNNKCDSGKKSTMWTIKNKVPKVIIKRNASGYCAVFRDVSSNPIWQPKIRLKRQKYIESLVLGNQSKKIPS